MLKISVYFLACYMGGKLYEEKDWTRKKEVLFEEHSKDYVIAKQKIINNFRQISSTIFIVFYLYKW